MLTKMITASQNAIRATGSLICLLLSSPAVIVWIFALVDLSIRLGELLSVHQYSPTFSAI